MVLLQAHIEQQSSNPSMIIIGIFRSVLFIAVLVLIIRFIIKLFKRNKKKSKSNNMNNVADQLLKLKNLLDQGVITQQEYDDKKTQLLNK